jgi:hypothetical protein
MGWTFKMETTKFNLLFENIMADLHAAEVTYKTLHDTVLDIIAEHIGMDSNEILEQNWNIDAYIAGEQDIISFVNDGFSNEVTRAEAQEKAGKLLIVDLEGLPLDEDTYNELIESKSLYDDILSAVQNSCCPEVEDIFMK